MENTQINSLKMLSEDNSIPNKNELLARMNYVENCQHEYSLLFDRLHLVIGQLTDKYRLTESNDEESTSTSEAAPSEVATSSADELPPIEPVKRKYQKLEEDDISLSSSKKIKLEYPKRFESSSSDVIIGPNGTYISEKQYNSICWSSASSATRQILAILFDSDTLASHTLTGKPSPAFLGRERPAKNQLDPKLTADIVYAVRTKCEVSEREVRSAITTKCADAAKKLKRRQKGRKTL